MLWLAEVNAVAWSAGSTSRSSWTTSARLWRYIARLKPGRLLQASLSRLQDDHQHLQAQHSTLTAELQRLKAEQSASDAPDSIVQPLPTQISMNPSRVRLILAPVKCLISGIWTLQIVSASPLGIQQAHKHACGQGN